MGKLSAPCCGLVFSAVFLAALVPFVSGEGCTTACDSCIAAFGATFSDGVTDEACHECATGENIYWPCDANTIHLCDCVGKGKPEAPRDSSSTGSACDSTCDTCVAAEGANDSAGVTDLDS